MISAEFRRARAILGLSADSLAAELGVTPAVIRAWDAGSTSIPARFGQHLAWLAARAERDAALAVSGIPVCEWLTARPELRLDAKAAEVAAEVSHLADHARSCPVCVARERFVAERFGPMPDPPAPAWMGVVAWLDGLPRWARPAVLVAGVVVAIVALRLLFSLPTLATHPGGVVEALGALLVAASADWMAVAIVAVVFGLVIGHSWLRSPRE